MDRFTSAAGFHADTSRLVKIASMPRTAIPTIEDAHEFADEKQDSGAWPQCVRITGSHRHWSFWREP